VDARVRRPDKWTIALGLVTAAMGAFFAVAASGVIVFGPECAHEDPRWVSVLAGVIFLLGGAAVVIRGIVGVDEQDPEDLPPSTPRWLRGVSQLMALAIMICCGAIFSWIGFGLQLQLPRDRQRVALRHERQIRQTGRCPILRRDTGG
jgi:drug/metabolite transporter (DMT)-like permease